MGRNHGEIAFARVAYVPANFLISVIVLVAQTHTSSPSRVSRRGSTHVSNSARLRPIKERATRADVRRRDSLSLCLRGSSSSRNPLNQHATFLARTRKKLDQPLRRAQAGGDRATPYVAIQYRSSIDHFRAAPVVGRMKRFGTPRRRAMHIRLIERVRLFSPAILRAGKSRREDASLENLMDYLSR